MLWKEFREQEDCSECPLLEAELCSGGFCCYGGEPIEPPCCSFDDDTDLDKWVENHLIQQLKWEEQEDRRIREEKKKKERAKKASDTRRAMRWYCRDEISDLKRAQNLLRAQKATEHFASSFVQAVNITNEMFRYEERIAVNSEVSTEVKRLEAEVISAKERYDAKRKEFYVQRKEAAP